MDSQEEYELSFYKDIDVLDSKHDVRLVKNIETGRFYVRKTVKGANPDVYHALMVRKYRGIPQVTSFIRQSEEDSYIVIESYINGTTLRKILDDRGALAEREAAGIISDLCDILRPLHYNNPPLVHRDIKPENMMITDDGQVYLIDFDASKSYHEGKHRDTELIGTRKYAAPEQYGYAQSDARTDIYALGKVMCEMLTGSTEDESSERGRAFDIIRKCIAIDPEDRYDSVETLKTDLCVLTGERVSETNSVPAGKNKFKIALILIVAAALIIIGVFAGSLLGRGQKDNGKSTNGEQIEGKTESSDFLDNYDDGDKEEDSKVDKEYANVKILDEGYSIVDGYIHYGVKVQNPNDDVAFKAVPFEVTAYNKDNEVIGVAQSSFGNMQPDEVKAEWAVIQCDDEKPVKVEITIDSSRAVLPSDDQVLSSDFKISKLKEKQDDHTCTVTGMITNNSEKNCEDTSVIVLFKNRGKIVYTAYAFPGRVDSGKSKSFQADAYQMPEHDSYEVLATDF